MLFANSSVPSSSSACTNHNLFLSANNSSSKGQRTPLLLAHMQQQQHSAPDLQRKKRPSSKTRCSSSSRQEDNNNNGIKCKMTMMDHHHHTNRMPRPPLDLKLAESYIPAAITMIKVLCYVCLCVVLHHSSRAALLCVPAVLLYYDHLMLPTPSFIDTTAVSTDVVAGTIATLVHFNNNNNNNSSLAARPNNANNMGLASLAIWVFLLAGVHISGLFLIPPLVGYAATGALVMSSLLLSYPEESPYYHVFFRAIAYLVLSLIDIYTLRGPMRRETDRINLLRYGAVLFAQSMYVLFPSILVLLALILSSINGWLPTLERTPPADKTDGEDDEDGSEHVAVDITSSVVVEEEDEDDAEEEADDDEPLAKLISSPSDIMDLNEAFRLAKAQHMHASGNNKGPV